MSGAKTLDDAGIDDLVANIVKACTNITKAASRRSVALKESCKTTLGLFYYYYYHFFFQIIINNNKNK